jgi:hypothetical protein
MNILVEANHQHQVTTFIHIFDQLPSVNLKTNLKPITNPFKSPRFCGTTVRNLKKELF